MAATCGNGNVYNKKLKEEEATKIGT